jgi:hypothetical protein
MFKLRFEKRYLRRKGLAEVFGKLLDDFRTPALLSLLHKDALADLPVEQDEFGVHGTAGPQLSMLNLRFEFLQPALVLGVGGLG